MDVVFAYTAIAILLSRGVSPIATDFNLESLRNRHDVSVTLRSLYITHAWSSRSRQAYFQLVTKVALTTVLWVMNVSVNSLAGLIKPRCLTIVSTNIFANSIKRSERQLRRRGS